MEKSGPGQDCQEIGSDGRPVSEDFANIPEYNLAHPAAGADIEHVNPSEGIEDQIETGGKQAAGKEESRASGESFPGVIGLSCESGDDSKDNQKDMPCKGVEGEQRKTIVHTSGIKKCEDTAKETEIHKKCQ